MKRACVKKQSDDASSKKRKLQKNQETKPTKKQKLLENEDTDQNPTQNEESTPLCYLPENAPPDLVKIVAATPTSPDSPWTEQEFAVFSKRLRNKKFQKYTSIDVAHIEALEMKVTPETLYDDNQAMFAEIAEYRRISCDFDIIQRACSAQELYDQLIINKPTRWTQQYVDTCVDFMKSINGIEIGTASPDVIDAFQLWYDSWGDYLSKHASVAARLDPWVVVALDVIAAPGGRWPSWPAGAPGALPAAWMGRPYIWSFANKDTAYLWVGICRSAIPGQRFLVTYSDRPPVLW